MWAGRSPPPPGRLPTAKDPGAPPKRRDALDARQPHRSCVQEMEGRQPAGAGWEGDLYPPAPVGTPWGFNAGGGGPNTQAAAFRPDSSSLPSSDSSWDSASSTPDDDIGGGVDLPEGIFGRVWEDEAATTETSSDSGGGTPPDDSPRTAAAPAGAPESHRSRRGGRGRPEEDEALTAHICKLFSAEDKATPRRPDYLEIPDQPMEDIFFREEHAQGTRQRYARSSKGQAVRPLDLWRLYGGASVVSTDIPPALRHAAGGNLLQRRAGKVIREGQGLPPYDDDTYSICRAVRLANPKSITISGSNSTSSPSAGVTVARGDRCGCITCWRSPGR